MAQSPLHYHLPDDEEFGVGSQQDVITLVMMLGGLGVLLLKSRSLLCALTLAGFSQWSCSRGAGREVDQKSIMSVISFVAMGFMAVYVQPYLLARRVAQLKAAQPSAE